MPFSNDGNGFGDDFCLKTQDLVRPWKLISWKPGHYRGTSKTLFNDELSSMTGLPSGRCSTVLAVSCQTSVMKCEID